MNTLACTDLQKYLTKKFIIQSMEGKKIGQIKGKNKHEKAGSQSHDTIHHYQPAYQIGLL